MVCSPGWSRQLARARLAGGGRRVRGAGLRVRGLVGRQPGAQHVLELQHVLHDVTDLYEREAVLARRRRLALARVAEDL